MNKLRKVIDNGTEHWRRETNAIVDIVNDIDNRVNKNTLMIEYLFYKEVDPERSAVILAQILGEKDE